MENVRGPFSGSSQSETEILHTIELIDEIETRQIESVIELAAIVCETKISAISFFDETKQNFLYSRGLGELRDLPRDQTLCEFTVGQNEALIIPDASIDPKFAATAEKFKIKFYVGYPLEIAGNANAVFCVISEEAKHLTEQQVLTLKVLAKQLQLILDGQEVKKKIRNQRLDIQMAIIKGKEKEDSFTQIIQENLDAVLIHDGDKILHANLQATRLLRKNASELENSKLSDHFISSDFSSSKVDFQSPQSVAEINKFNGKSAEVRIQTKDLIFNDQNVKISFVRENSSFDILKNSLRDSEARFESLADNLPGAVFRFTVDIDRKLRFTYLSSGLERIFETSRELLMEDLSVALNLTMPDDLSNLLDVLVSAIEEKRKFEWTGRIKMVSGVIKWVQYIAQPTTDSSTNLMVWDGIAFDITDKKHVETKLIEQNALMETSSKMASLGELAAGLAHEINNAVNYISNSVPGLHRYISKSDESEEKTKAIKYLEAIRQGSRVTTEIINNLRTYSHAGDATEELVDLQSVFSTILPIIASKLKEKDIEVTVDIPSRTAVYGYRGGLNQIFLNLISNASDALHISGIINITAAEKDDRVTVVIQDDGPGISPATLKRIYEPFFTTKEIGRGTGLGLFVVHKEVTRIGGSIRCDSKLGIGTKFEIVFENKSSSLAEVA